LGGTAYDEILADEDRAERLAKGEIEDDPGDYEE
jgi:hypothetical protein